MNKNLLVILGIFLALIALYLMMNNESNQTGTMNNTETTVNEDLQINDLSDEEVPATVDAEGDIVDVSEEGSTEEPGAMMDDDTMRDNGMDAIDEQLNEVEILEEDFTESQ